MEVVSFQATQIRQMLTRFKLKADTQVLTRDSGIAIDQKTIAWK